MIIIKILKLSLAEQIYENLRKDIIENKLTGGQKITIKQIQDMYGVSSTPAREALYILSKDGLIEMHTNQGVNVVDFTLEKSLEIHEVNQLLDLYALKKAMEHPNRQALITRLEETFDISAVQHKKGNYLQLYYNNYFHNVFFDFVDNRIIKDLKQSYKALFSIVVLKAHFYEDFLNNQEDHTEILDAIKKDDLDTAIKLFEEHFEGGRDRLLKYYNVNKEEKSLNKEV